MNIDLLSKEVLDIINKIRTEPNSLIPNLEEMLNKFDGLNYRIGPKLVQSTKEGSAAVKEAINFLKTAQCIPALSSSSAISDSCKELGLFQMKNKSTSTVASDGLCSRDRLLKYGDWIETFNEIVQWGYQNPQDAILRYLINDGDPQRSGRRILFSTSFKYFGAYFGPHPEYKTVLIVNFAGDMMPKGYHDKMKNRHKNMDWDIVIKDVWEAQNQLRTNPKSFIPHLEKMLTTFEGFKMKVGPGYYTNTKEGPSAVQETINFLKKQQPVCALEFSEGISLACRDHGLDQIKNNFKEHEGSDGSRPSDRISRYGKWLQTCGENLAWGFYSGFDFIAGLLVDDDVPDRGHRKNLFQPNFKICGIWCGPHPSDLKTSCVIEYAGGFIPNKILEKKSEESIYKIEEINKKEILNIQNKAEMLKLPPISPISSKFSSNILLESSLDRSIPISTSTNDSETDYGRMKYNVSKIKRDNKKLTTISHISESDILNHLKDIQSISKSSTLYHNIMEISKQNNYISETKTSKNSSSFNTVKYDDFKVLEKKQIFGCKPIRFRFIKGKLCCS